MSISVFTIHKTVIINKVLVACVVRRIDIDNVYFPLMRIGKGGKGFKVIPFY